MLMDVGGGKIRPMTPADPQLFPRRIQNRFPPPNGADVAFSASDESGAIFYCKKDSNGRHVRATEFICTRLSDHLGFRTPAWSIMEEDGETFFGSQHEISSAGPFVVQDFLTKRRTDELGRIYHFPGAYLAQTFALDMFLGNLDRGLSNFLLVQDGRLFQVCLIDFVESRLMDLTSERFPVAQSSTVLLRKRLSSIHDAFDASAIEMVDRIEAVPKEVFLRYVDETPEDWLGHAQREAFSEVWGSPGFHNRLATLRARLLDGTLL